MRYRRAALAVGLVVLAGCSGGAPPPSAGSSSTSSPGATAQVRTAVPRHPLTVIADRDPAAEAIATSRALFATSGLVIQAGTDDRAGQLLAASAAVGLGVPLLLAPGEAGRAVTAELDRLQAATVLVVGSSAASPGTGSRQRAGRTVITVPAVRATVAEVTGLRLPPDPPVSAAAAPAAVAALDRKDPAALMSAESEPAATPSSAGGARRRSSARLPRVHRNGLLSGVLLLATGEPTSLAALATARAAGTRIRLTEGRTDPRAAPGVIAALSQQTPAAVVALGAGWVGAQGLDWKFRTAATGTQLPGGGQLLFPLHVLVALYGAPGSPALGVLGEQGPAATIERARRDAARYQGLVNARIVPTLEIIATVAARDPGPDGNYSTEADPERLRTWVEAAGAAGLYVVLDLQPGRTDFLTQARRYRSLLELPYVGLALDPEWRLGPGQRHLEQVGSVAVEEVNGVIGWLADLTRERALPQKLLVVHQFRLDMVHDRERLDTSRDELAVMIHADGQGSQAAKQSTWRTLHQDLPPGPLFWGWKNFYDEDAPMLDPGETIEQVQPTPNLITYQ